MPRGTDVAGQHQRVGWAVPEEFQHQVRGRVAVLMGTPVQISCESQSVGWSHSGQVRCLFAVWFHDSPGKRQHLRIANALPPRLGKKRLTPPRLPFTIKTNGITETIVYMAD